MPEVAEYDRITGDTGDRLADIMHKATLGQFNPDTGKKGEDFAMRTARGDIVSRFPVNPST